MKNDGKQVDQKQQDATHQWVGNCGEGEWKKTWERESEAEIVCVCVCMSWEGKVCLCVSVTAGNQAGMDFVSWEWARRDFTGN